ncbi:MAG: ABC transporter permease [Nitriliruptorales bacterium]
MERRPQPEPDTTPAFEAAGDEQAAALEGGAPLSGRQAGLWADAWRDLRRNPFFVVSAVIILVLTVIAIRPSLFTGVDPQSCQLSNSLQRPSAVHWFGFDLQGCDYYARTIYGARVSMTIGVAVTSFAALIAIVFGSLAGYYGGAVDTLVARVSDIWFALPTILGGIVAISVLRNPGAGGALGAISGLFRAIDEFANVNGLAVVTFVLVALGWPTMLRLMRSSVLSVKEMDYVTAARALGGSDTRIILQHILPNAIAPVVVYATIEVGIIIAAEAALSFLGVGLQLPAISWGLMISVAQTRILDSPHLLLFPGGFLSVTVFSFILMGDALRDALDPRLR